MSQAKVKGHTIVWRKLRWRHNDVISHSNFMKFKHKSTKGISNWHTEFNFDEKLTENYKEKMDIMSLWPRPLTQGHKIQWGLSQFRKQPLSKNRVQNGASVRLEFCSQEVLDTQTHRQTDKLQWKYKPSTISWRCNKNSNIFAWC